MFFAFAFIFFVVFRETFAQPPLISTPIHDPVKSIQGLISRKLGPVFLPQFIFRVIELNHSVHEFDISEISVVNNKIELAGSCGTAFAVALQWYLSHVLRTQTDWNEHQLIVPKLLPKTFKATRLTRAVPYTYYQNVCTSSYSMWSWDWHKWEKHIDWMALKGINMPLAFTGQEKIWQRTFQNHFNISSKGIQAFFTGASFLAWGRMGNVRGSWVTGHLPQDFIDDQFSLQLRILQRMKEFGMIPALPAFAGHVPKELKLKFPKAKIEDSPRWCKFPDQNCCVAVVDPTDPLFTEIGKRFLMEQRRMYNNWTSSLYQCDSYNEMSPTSSDLAYLSSSSKAVIESINAADTDGVWLMQGWLFHVQPNFWNKERIKAYLAGVSNKKMIILDLYSEVFPVWRNYYGKYWIYCVLHNFGGAVGMRGDLLTVGSDPIYSNRESKGTMIGIGITMEGIFQNYIVYDLSLSMAWQHYPYNWKNITTYVKRYVAQRYNVFDFSNGTTFLLDAWKVLASSLYNCTKGSGGVTRSIVTFRPSWKLEYAGFLPTKLMYSPQHIQIALHQLLRAAKIDKRLRKSDTYLHDVVDVTRQMLSDKLMFEYKQLRTVYHKKKKNAIRICGLTESIKGLILDMDKILATQKAFSFGIWMDNAVKLAKNKRKHVSYYKYQAKNQISRWGERNDNFLNDYAGKQWSGLIKSYYFKRWNFWLKEVCESATQKRPLNENLIAKQTEQFEVHWQLNNEQYLVNITGDAMTVAEEMYCKYCSIRRTSPNVLWKNIFLSYIFAAKE